MYHEKELIEEVKYSINELEALRKKAEEGSYLYGEPFESAANRGKELAYAYGISKLWILGKIIGIESVKEVMPAEETTSQAPEEEQDDTEETNKEESEIAESE